MADYIRCLGGRVAAAMISTAQHPAFGQVEIIGSPQNSSHPEGPISDDEPEPAVEIPGTAAWRDNEEDSDDDRDMPLVPELTDPAFNEASRWEEEADRRGEMEQTSNADEFGCIAISVALGAESDLLLLASRITEPVRRRTTSIDNTYMSTDGTAPVHPAPESAINVNASQSNEAASCPCGVQSLEDLRKKLGPVEWNSHIPWQMWEKKVTYEDLKTWAEQDGQDQAVTADSLLRCLERWSIALGNMVYCVDSLRQEFEAQYPANKV